MTATLTVNNLDYSYGNLPVLKNLTFCIQEGCFFIILGPNGSGKTTLMKVLCGIAKPQNGKLEILGHALQHYSRKALARVIAFVPQLIPFDFPFTVQEVVLMGRSPHLGMIGLERKEDFEISNQAMAFTEVDHLARRKIDQLSGGERQRVFIARAICQQPKIMLLDEPTASLDLAHQVKVMDLMEKLRQDRKITIVMVSHDINLASMYADNLLLLKGGNIVKMGIPKEVLTYSTLEETYGCMVLVDENPLGKAPRITPVPGKFNNR